MDAAKEYIQVYEPDKQALKEVLADCKGSDRTMAQFADASGISASTLSRISNGNITKPLTEETIRAIFEARAEGCKATIDDLYRANGMLTKEERNRMTHGMESRRRVLEIQETAQQVIINELLMRGYAVKAEMSKSVAGRSTILDARTDKERGDLSFRYDLAITLPELHDLSEWLFMIMPQSSGMPSGYERSPEVEARMAVRRGLQMRSEIFLVDAWQPERLAGLKFSWVFTDPIVYDAFREYLKTAKLNNAMTTILIDPVEKTVLKEEWMNCPMKDDYASLFCDPNGKMDTGTDFISCYKSPWVYNKEDGE